MTRPLSILLYLSLCAALSLCAGPVLAQLRAEFSMDRTGGCSPLVVRFTNHTTGASASATYQWDLGNNNTAAVSDPQALYIDETSYTVTLTVHDGGNVSAVTHTVTVYPHPVPSFSYSPGTVCGPQPITFTGGATGGGSIVNWLWDFGDGVTMQTGSPATQHVYPSTISTPVSLTVTNNYGCTNTVSQPVAITVLTPATSSFTSDKQVLCLVTDAVQFTNASTGVAPLTYSWDFGDGSTSTQASPGHSYAQKGVYTVTLKTTAANGCSATSSQPNYLNVASYSTDFDVPATDVCQNTTVAFRDNSYPTATSKTWTVDGLTVAYYSPMQYTFSSAGTYTVTLKNVFGNCPQQTTRTVTIDPAPVPSFDEQVTRACDKISVKFTDKTPGATAWSWNFNYYQGGSEQLSAGPTITQTFPYNQYFSVRLSVKNGYGCPSSIIGQAYAPKNAPAIYEPSPTPSLSCQTPVTKTYAIQNLNQLQSFHWDLGDGTTSADAQPTHVYSGTGTYTAILYYTDIDGCTGSTSYTPVIISPAEHADFSASPTTVCAGSNVNFSIVSTDANYTAWDFGDGAIGYVPNHVYSTPGTYPVSLTVRNIGGCQATVNKPNLITVLAVPGVFNGHSNTCDGDRTLVTFTYTPGSATGVLWNFGDGATMTTSASTTQVQHTYAGTGTYYPEITASNSTCSATNSDKVMVLKKQQPRLSASSAIACIGGTLDVHLTIERNPAGISTGYYYDYAPQFQYSDGTPFTGNVDFTSPFQPYSNNAFHWTLSGFTPGKSGLKVVTTSFGFGCTDESNTIPLTIKGSATAAMKVVSDNVCYQTPVVLQDISTPGANNSIVSEYWDFGDGQSFSWNASQVGGTLKHLYNDPGQYPVRLTLTDAGGCTTTTGANLTYVSANGPKANFTVYPGTDVNLNTTCYFYNSSNYYGSSNTVWSWDLGDGTTASDYSPSHTYTAPGVYHVQLQARDATKTNTCVTTATATITVRNFNSHFSVSPSYVGTSSCPPVLAQFYNTSSNYTSVSWDFGDGWTAGNVNAPSHVYQLPGHYIITLHVNGYNGLTADYIDSVIVRQPAATLAADNKNMCAGDTKTFYAHGTDAKSYTWDFGDGTVGSASYPDSVISHVFAAGVFNAQLIVTDVFGCSTPSNVTVAVAVHALPVVSISPADPFLCKDASLTLTAAGAVVYQWSPATGLDRADVAAPVASPSESTVYTVLGTDANLCQNSASSKVTVVFPQTLSVTPDSTSVCKGDAVALKASGTDVYSWIGFVDGLSSLSDGAVMARPSEAGVYTVVGSDAHACFFDTAKIIVTVLPVPTVDGGADQEVLAANPVLLAATGSSDIVKWEWSPPDYLNCVDCAQPVASPRKPERYIVTVTNDVLCSARDTVDVKILCVESYVRIPDAFSPNGDGKNDRFVILGIGQVKHLVIYNRWGVKVWERNNFYPADSFACWDGTVNGQPAPVGAYAYYVEMECPSGGVFGRRGTVVLVR